MNLTSCIDPSLLNSSVRSKKISVFLCGPGIGTQQFEARKSIKDILTQNHNANVTYGEDLEVRTNRRNRRADMQTIEAAHAHNVDFTILMLNSPGSIAELGTFSMIPNVMHRLYVIVPSEFYNSGSYIERGPLSLMSAVSSNNIFYLDNYNEESLKRALSFPVMLYKYSKYMYSYTYSLEITRHFRTQTFGVDDYETSISPMKENFLNALVASTVYLRGKPTFSELLNSLHIDPRSLSSALSRLFTLNFIEKTSGGRYELINGISTNALSGFDKMRLSKRRAHQLAFS